MKVTDIITCKIVYDSFRGTLWVGNEKLAQLNNLTLALANPIFENRDQALNFGHEIGQWIADAINEKLEREKSI